MVKDILFDGFNVQTYVDLANDPLVQSAGEVNLPERILDGRMGLLEGVSRKIPMREVVIIGIRISIILVVSVTRKTVRTRAGWSLRLGVGPTKILGESSRTMETHISLFGRARLAIGIKNLR